MVWFHGGGFYYWSSRSDVTGPGYLLTEDIVLVTVNYRLGILGFLKAQDPSLEVYGNAGLKDQQFALKWVQRNIRAFGGDPNNVTIFGESAGGASVHFHILSPSSKGLFHKAILQSGVAINRWAQEPSTPISLIELVKNLNKEATNENEALEILKCVSVEELFAAQEIERKKCNSIFLPVVELPNHEAFITGRPLEIISCGQYNKVPMMMGYNSAETMYFIIDKVVKEKQGLKYIDKYSSIEDVLPKEIRKNASPEIIQQLCQKILNVYNKYENKIPMLSDVHFVEGIIRAAKLHCQVSSEPIYFYKMDIDDELNFYKKSGPPIDIQGMCHCDDLGYLFTMKNIPLAKKGSSAEIAMRRVVKLWTNFARFGTPTPNETQFHLQWNVLTKESFNYLEISSELINKVDPESDRIKLWDEIMEIAENYKK